VSASPQESRVQVRVTIDCTPQEARAFFGLPDLGPLHAFYLDKMQSWMSGDTTPAELEKLMRLWSAGMAEGFEQWQRLFWQAAGAAGGTVAPPAQR
jgi:hypothetical protein